MRKALPFIKTNYFEGNYRVIFRQLTKYVAKYNRLPTQEAFMVEIEENLNLSPDHFTEVANTVPDVFVNVPVDEEWLFAKTEKWCQDRAIYLAVMESIDIIDGKSEKLQKGAIPELLTEALSVSFDTHIGHDYLDDAEARYDYYNRIEEKIPFDLEMMNYITNGGLSKKTLTVALAGTGVGKSLFMCHQAAAAIAMGYDVLYITMEMSEEKIAERIDANLLDVDIKDIGNLSREKFQTKINKLRSKAHGKLIIKEYPTSQASTAHFRALLNELKLKKRFRPQLIFIDYLNICASARLKGMGGSINSYSYVKAIAEEIRGLAVEFDVPIVTATQTTRGGYENSDPSLTDTSESFGLPATADFMFALISDEELEKDGHLMIKQLKNRYNDANVHRRFLIGINRSYMRLFDISKNEQTLNNEPPAIANKPDKSDKLKNINV